MVRIVTRESAPRIEQQATSKTKCEMERETNSHIYLDCGPYGDLIDSKWNGVSQIESSVNTFSTIFISMSLKYTTVVRQHNKPMTM